MTLDELQIIRYCLKLAEMSQISNWEHSKVKQAMTVVDRDIKLKLMNPVTGKMQEENK